MRLIATVLLGIAMTGCTAMRLFQQKVPEPISKAPQQLEAERVAADLIARKLETPVELKPVATSLSTSLGAPQRSLLDVKTFELPAAAKRADAGLQEGILQMQEQLRDLNVKLMKLQGKEIEGTGFSVLGPGMSVIVIGLIVLGVVFPPAFTLMGIAYRRLKQTAGMVVEQIDEASKEPEAKEAMRKVKERLSASMDTAHKQVIHSLQKP